MAGVSKFWEQCLFYSSSASSRIVTQTEKMTLHFLWVVNKAWVSCCFFITLLTSVNCFEYSSQYLGAWGLDWERDDWNAVHLKMGTVGLTAMAMVWSALGQEGNFLSSKHSLEWLCLLLTKLKYTPLLLHCDSGSMNGDVIS